MALYLQFQPSFQLPAPADIAEARANLPRFIEYGVLNAHSLQMIYQLMENVFVPYLNTKTTAAVEGDTNQAKPQMLRKCQNFLYIRI